MDSSPIFIHSLFRAGSTYLFSAFRRSPAGYWCYQEPLHEYIRYAAEAPDRLLDIDFHLGSALRHPTLQQPYFWEFYEVKDGIAPLFRKELSYDSFFAREGNPTFELAASYFQALLDRARGRPMLQCCRSFGRAAALRRRFGGLHIHLWRNPWDQWWSYQVDGYFDVTNQLILNASELPSVLRAVKELCSLADFHDPKIETEIDHASNHRLSARTAYLAFYSLWLYSLIETERIADVSINIDVLSSSVAYRRRTLEGLRSKGVTELDFSDCHVAQSGFGNADSAFFESVERDVHEMFAEHGYDASELTSALRLRASRRPKPRPASAQLVESAARVRELAIKQMDRLAESQRHVATHTFALERSRQFANSMERECEALRTALATVHGDIAMAREDLRRRVAEISILNFQTAELTIALAKRADFVVTLQDQLSSHHLAMLTAREYATNLEKELSAVRSRVDELHREMTRWVGIANDIHNHLQAVYATRSWRLTAPLRWLKSNFGAWQLVPVRLWKTLVGLVRRMAALVIGRTARYLQTHPRTKGIVVRTLARFPRPYQRLRSIAFRHGVQRAAPASGTDTRPQLTDPFHSIEGGDPARYSPSVLNIHRLLVAARETPSPALLDSSQQASSS